MAPQSAMVESQIINEEADHNRDWKTLKKVVGIKFKPSAVVLTGYLVGKVFGSNDGPIFPLIQEVDVYQYEPSKLKRYMAPASASFPLKASASVPLRTSDLDKVSGNRRLTNFKSDYVFIFYSGPDDLKRYDRMDFGLYGRSWLANASWSIVFAPGVNEDTWRDYLRPAKSNFMDTGDLLNVVASGSSNGLLFAVSAKGFHQRAVHGIRTLIPLDEVKNDSRLKSGGSLLLNIGLLEMKEDGEVRADTDYTFDGYVSWNLYLN